MSKSGGRGFFAGSLASVYRNVPHSMLAYTVYPKAEAKVLALQQQLTVSSGATVDETRSFSTRFYAGYATLLFTTAITHPLDTLRVRLSVRANCSRHRPGAPTLHTRPGCARARLLHITALILHAFAHAGATGRPCACGGHCMAAAVGALGGGERWLAGHERRHSQGRGRRRLLPRLRCDPRWGGTPGCAGVRRI